MVKEFQQIVWDDRLEDDLRAILRLAIEEDIGRQGDWTTDALVDKNVAGMASVVARQSGVVAGAVAVPTILDAVEPRLKWSPMIEDGERIEAGGRVGIIEGPARGLLTAERILLNFLGRLSGIATLTQQYVDATTGTTTRIYDTRKTTPGWRRLEKYAVRCGGGNNHRGGLFEAVLIKDNHLAFGSQTDDGRQRFSPAQAVLRARKFVADRAEDANMPIEVEVDTIEQLEAVLPSMPDIVLLDNMTPHQLAQAVAIRNAFDRSIELEASGGVNLSTLLLIAQTGVDRISVGALTHSAISLDFSLDW